MIEKIILDKYKSKLKLMNDGKCLDCEGKGEFPSFTHMIKCETCKGSGKTKLEDTPLTLTLPSLIP